MQDLDFSTQISGKAVQSSRTKQIESPEKLKSKRRVRTTEILSGSKLASFLIISSLCFSGGIIAGIGVQKSRQIEGELQFKIDRKSDPSPSSRKAIGFASKRNSRYNASQDSFGKDEQNILSLKNPSPAPKGSYLIKVGTYTLSNAQKVIDSLSLVEELKNEKVQECAHIQRNSLLTHISFMVAVPNSQDKTNVFIGCYQDADSAKKVLSLLLLASIPQTSLSRIYQTH